MAKHQTRKAGSSGRAATIARRTQRSVKTGAARVSTAGRAR